MGSIVGGEMRGVELLLTHSLVAGPGRVFIFFSLYMPVERRGMIFAPVLHKEQSECRQSAYPLTSPFVMRDGSS